MINETNTLDEFRDKFRVSELQIINTGAWTWSIRPDQPTLGSGIISLNRYALHLSDVTPEEMAELAGLISTLENAIEKTFNHNIMNYLVLMMIDHHVHYHVVPRYDGPKQFASIEWIDIGWPALPAMQDSQHKNQEGILQLLRDTLKTVKSSSK